MYVHTCTQHTYTHTQTQMYTHIYTHTDTHTGKHIDTNAQIDTHVCAQIHKQNIHTDIYNYVHIGTE